MLPELAVDLMEELEEETDLRPPIVLMPVGRVDSATQDILGLLLEVPSGQPTISATTMSGSAPQPNVSSIESVQTSVAVPPSTPMV